jgi:hypothetical protein
MRFRRQLDYCLKNTGRLEVLLGCEREKANEKKNVQGRLRSCHVRYGFSMPMGLCAGVGFAQRSGG